MDIGKREKLGLYLSPTQINSVIKNRFTFTVKLVIKSRKKGICPPKYKLFARFAHMFTLNKHVTSTFKEKSSSSLTVPIPRAGVGTV